MFVVTYHGTSIERLSAEITNGGEPYFGNIIIHCNYAVGDLCPDYYRVHYGARTNENGYVNLYDYIPHAVLSMNPSISIQPLEIDFPLKVEKYNCINKITEV